MAPKAASPKKKSPAKKKLAVKADYGGVYFGEKQDAPDPAEDEPPEDDPLASYRAAAAAASKAAEKERKDEAQQKLFRKIFAAMDSDHDGKVEMADMVERVAAGTSQLSHRAQATRPQGSVALQLPMVFTLNEWLAEMKRMTTSMDEETFQANVLGLFACFDDAPTDAPVVLGPVPGAKSASAPAAAPSGSSSSGAGPSLDRDGMLRELFATMDADADGVIDLTDFLMQARTSEESTELRGLFNFFDTNFGARDATLTFEAFAEGTLSRTPLGRMRDAAFASAIRGMLADVKTALAVKANATKRLGLLQELFTTLDVKKAGTIDLDAFVATAKNPAEADELRETFQGFDESLGGTADGVLTFRKFCTGTMTTTPLGRMKDEAFETTLTSMIADAKATTAAGKAPAAAVELS